MKSSFSKTISTAIAILACAAGLAIPAAVAPAHAYPDVFGRTPAATAQMARHFDHEDALYRLRSTGGEPRTSAQAMALHFNHEDAVYRGDSVRPSRSAAQTLALHFDHEDSLYGAQRSAVAPPAVEAASDGFDWIDALVGAGGAMGMVLFGAAAVVAVQRGRRRSRLVHS